MDLVNNLSQKDLSDSIIGDIYAGLKHNTDTISKISKMIEKGIDMSGQRDSEFYVRPETQQSLQVIMKRKNSIDAEINQEVFKVAKHLQLEV
jgi:hypothetical protein